MCWFFVLLSSQLAPVQCEGMAVWLQNVVILSRQDTEHNKEGGGEINPPRLSFVVYGV